MKICGNCGASLPDDTTVCNYCGAFVGGYGEESPEPPKRRSAGISIAAFIACLILPPLGVILGILALVKKSAAKGLAIAAIIVGALGFFITSLFALSLIPSITEYTEKSKVAEDTQLCELYRIAINTSMVDPSIMEKIDSGIPTEKDTWIRVSSIPAASPFGHAVEEITGIPIGEAETHIVSSFEKGKAEGLEFIMDTSGNPSGYGYRVRVRIKNSDKTGKKGRDGANPIEAN